LDGVAKTLSATDFFVGPKSRKAVNAGIADYIPIYFSAAPKLLRGGPLTIDVGLLQVSSPDEHGFCSLGIGVDVNKSVSDTASVVIAQVNRRMPRTLGTASFTSATSTTS